MSNLNCDVTKNGYVYALTFEDGHTKVGKTAHPHQRIKMITLSCGRGKVVDMTVFETGNYSMVESNALKSLSEYNISSEWFLCDHKVAIDAIESLTRPVLRISDEAANRIREDRLSRIDALTRSILVPAKLDQRRDDSVINDLGMPISFADSLLSFLDDSQLMKVNSSLNTCPFLTIAFNEFVVNIFPEGFDIYGTIDNYKIDFNTSQIDEGLDDESLKWDDYLLDFRD
jgi:hypothetical protein